MPKRKRSNLSDDDDADNDDEGTDSENEADELQIDNKTEISELTEREYCLRKFLHERFQQLGPDALSLLERIVSEKETKKDEDGLSDEKKPYIPSLRAIERFFARMSVHDREVVYWKITAFPDKPPEVIPVHVFDSYRRIRTMWQQRYLDPFGRRVPTNLWRFRTTICQAICIGWMIQTGLLDRLQYLETQHPISIPIEKKTKKNSMNDVNKKKPSTTASRLKAKCHDSCVFEYPVILSHPPSSSDLESVPLLIANEDATREYYKHLLRKRCCRRQSAIQDQSDSIHFCHLFKHVTWDATLRETNKDVLQETIPPILQPEIVTFATVNAADEAQLRQIFNVKQTKQSGPKPRYTSTGELIQEVNGCVNLHIPLVSPALSMKSIGQKIVKGISKKKARALHLENVQRFYWDQSSDWNPMTGLPTFFDIPRDSLNGVGGHQQQHQSSFSLSSSKVITHTQLDDHTNNVYQKEIEQDVKSNGTHEIVSFDTTHEGDQFVE